MPPVDPTAVALTVSLVFGMFARVVVDVAKMHPAWHKLPKHVRTGVVLVLTVAGGALTAWGSGAVADPGLALIETLTSAPVRSMIQALIGAGGSVAMSIGAHRLGKMAEAKGS